MTILTTDLLTDANSHLPRWPRATTLADRRALNADAAARHPSDPLASIVSLGPEEVLLEDSHGNPVVRQVEYFCRPNRLLKAVAVRYDDGPIEWLQQAQAPPPSPSRRNRGYIIPRRKRERLP